MKQTSFGRSVNYPFTRVIARCGLRAANSGLCFGKHVPPWRGRPDSLSSRDLSFASLDGIDFPGLRGDGFEAKFGPHDIREVLAVFLSSMHEKDRGGVLDLFHCL